MATCPGGGASSDCTGLEIATSLDPAIVCQERCDDGITAGGGLVNCLFDNENRLWLCHHSESQDWVPSDGQNAIFYTCETLPIFEPDEKNCDCGIYLGDPAQELDIENICRGCVILPSPNATDGTSSYEWDCSDLLVGDCVGRQAGDCISSEDATCSQGINEFGLEGAPGQQLFFDIEVSAGETVTCESSGGTGDARK